MPRNSRTPRQITGSTAPEQALAQVQAHYQYVFENVNDAVFIHDLTGRFLEVNQVACDRLGYSREELLQMAVQQLDAPEMAAHFDEGMQGLIQKKSVVAESCHVRKDRSCVPVELSVRLIQYKGSPAVLTVARDISERKRLEEEIKHRNQELETMYAQAEERARRIAALQEQIASMAIREERDRIGRELHDGLGQVLGYIGMKTAQLEEWLARGRTEDAQKGLADLHSLAQSSYRDVREAILGLRTTVGGDVGLEAILHGYLAHYQREWGIATELVVGEGKLPPLTPSVEIQLLRIIQEALTNTRKHAEAQSVRVVFESDVTRLHVTVVDDGVGFDSNESRQGHFGLDTMRERAESVDGHLIIDSAPGAGTRIHITLPRGDAK